MRLSRFTVAICLPLTGGAVAADIVSLTPVADATLAGALPNNNYGSGGSLAVSAVGLPNGEFQSLLRFDTTSAVAAFNTSFGAGQWSVTSITLRLSWVAPNSPIYNTPNAAGQLAAAWQQNDSWTEGTGSPQAPSATGVNYASLAGLIGGSDQAVGTFATGGQTTGSTTYALALGVPFVADVSAGGLTTLRLSAADSGIVALFYSRNFGTVSSRPELAITAVPGPGVVGLLALWVGVATGSSRRR